MFTYVCIVYMYILYIYVCRYYIFMCVCMHISFNHFSTHRNKRANAIQRSNQHIHTHYFQTNFRIVIIVVAAVTVVAQKVLIPSHIEIKKRDSDIQQFYYDNHNNNSNKNNNSNHNNHKIKTTPAVSRKKGPSLLSTHAICFTVNPRLSKKTKLLRSHTTEVSRSNRCGSKKCYRI